jgi:phage major head subunit gpT-like protein
MKITVAALLAMNVGFRADFQNAFGAVPKMKDRVAKTVPSSGTSNVYGWLKGLSGMREWLGPRLVDNLSEASYTIANRHFEKTVGVDRNHIEDDQLGIYKDAFAIMGEGAARLPEELVWGLLKDGFTTNCWDGQSFFDTDHPILDKDGNNTTYANTDGGSGTPWFLICSNRPLKPIIYQERKPVEFVAKDRPEDENVFNNRQFVYGADMRCNVGYGLPQTAWGSKQTLNAANYAIARAAIQNMKGDGGAPLGLVPDLLIVPPSLESAARKIVGNQMNDAGATNEWYGTAEPLIVPWLA